MSIFDQSMSTYESSRTASLMGWLFLFAFLIVAGITLRILVILQTGQLDGDSAVFALMAKYIYELKEFPIYVWNAHYAGALPSYLGAFLFTIFGVSAVTYKAVGVIYSCIWVYLTWLLLRHEHYTSESRFVALCAVLVPPMSVLSMSLFVGGCHPETLIFTNLLFLLLIKFNNRYYDVPLYFCAIFGFLAGFGFWVTPGIIPALMTLLIVFFMRDKKFLCKSFFLWFASGFIIGFLPAIIYNFQYPGATLFRMGGRILNLDRDVLDSGNSIEYIARAIVWRISTIPGSLVNVPVLIVQSTGWLTAAAFAISLLLVLRRQWGEFLKEVNLNTIFLIYIACFIIFYVTLIGDQPVRRVVPLYTAYPVLIAGALSTLQGKLKNILLVLIVFGLSANLYENLQLAASKRDNGSTALKEYLLSQDIHYGFSDYHTAYALIFDSEEKLLISPTLYHPTYDDRRPAYTREARRGGNFAYILDGEHYPESVRVMEEKLRQQNIQFTKIMIGEFTLYHSLSRTIYPEELILPKS